MAPAKAPALIKLRMCVTGDKIVLATCEAAFGKRIPNLYAVPISLLFKIFEVTSKAGSYIYFLMYFASNGVKVKFSPACLLYICGDSYFLNLGSETALSPTSSINSFLVYTN